MAQTAASALSLINEGGRPKEKNGLALYEKSVIEQRSAISAAQS